ncbi:MAG: hypothetical protein JSV91_01730 [Phycisphaerales bacterium]|nr:MAG: hypothetical protein JSV91_01730 [Phycisphaerales bacterium]
MARPQTVRRAFAPALILVLAPFVAGQAAAQEDLVMRALADELDRSMTLQLEDLQKPYFVQFTAIDTYAYRITATCGAIVTSDDNQSRRIASEVRVGDYELDNTNFGGGGGQFRPGRRGGGGRGASGMAQLPLEDDYAAIRQAAWLATDGAYKSAVETLTQKQAYMENREYPDRPDDFARAEAVVAIESPARMTLDSEECESRLRSVSQRFLDHPSILDSSVSLTASAITRRLVNSEGSKLRAGATSFVLTISAQVQAEDGEQLSDRITYHADTPEGLPSVAEMLADVDELATLLTLKREAPVLEDYMGPVLFDGLASPQVFNTLLARGVAAQVDAVGAGRRRFGGTENLEKYLNKRILPRSFQIYDDPRTASVGEDYLAGHYLFDDEGVEAQRVDLVANGRLEAMLMSRTPTQDFPESNGHGRSGGIGRARAAAGCLFITTSDGLPDEELKQALIEAAEDQDLDYALRVVSIGGAGRGGAARQAFGGRGFGRVPSTPEGSALGDPIAIYKVYLDGREELVRGCEFAPVSVSALKDIIAAGETATVYNTGRSAGSGTSIIAPAVIFEEIEIYTIEEERQKEPVIAAPHLR